MPPIFDVFNPLTLKLAPMIGAFMVASAIGFLRDGNRAKTYLRELSASVGISRLTGAIALFGGGLIVLYHNDFSSAAASILSGLGIFWTLEGFALLLMADKLPLRSDGTVTQFRLFQWVGLALGVFLLIAGMFGKAGL